MVILHLYKYDYLLFIYLLVCLFIYLFKHGSMWDIGNAQDCLLFCSQCSINPTFNQDRKFNLIKHNSQHSVPKLSDIKTLINTIS